MGLAVEIIALVFGSLFLIAAVITVGVLVASDKLTLPGSEIRRVKKAAADLEVSKYREQQMLVDLRMDNLHDQRLERALNPPPKQEGVANG